MSEYERNYDQIARDYVAHWRKTGRNPFQDPNEQAAHENATLALVERYVAPDSSLLDAGCGMGDLMRRLEESYYVKGCDIAEPLLEIARERGLDVSNSFIEDMPYPDECFDAVVATDILEHVLDLNAALRELLRVLKPGGFLIVRVPNEEDLSQYLDPVPYKFIHLRRFDQVSTRLFLTKVFDLKIVEMSIAHITLNVVCRKP